MLSKQIKLKLQPELLKVMLIISIKVNTLML
nr:MAG TPA: hypothetical protein [Crassvirales sp.]DAP79179.1 MAG TPA: hypothetical protein [Caudoviricetes sp.]